MNHGDDPAPGRWWVRAGVLVAFAGGALAGFSAHDGISFGWTPTVLVLIAGGVLLLWVGALIGRRAVFEPEPDIPLPSEKYGGSERPDPKQPQAGSLDGRIPFHHGKDVVKRDVNPRMAKLHDKLTALNQQLQRANVKLGLGELSKEGYQKIVAEIKERRAKVEHEISQQEIKMDDPR